MKDTRSTISCKVSPEYAAGVWDYVHAHKMTLTALILAAINEYMENHK